ncbi:glycosyltransferase [Sulfuricurvum sp.]|uniref:glycosyltransferase n=1 Tax=Sulfuricurvum sp. TaxID=2025608 RepID=UPI002612C9EA|nr:glycosyltransferase [Sulfuricurvum sp.]MDD2267530.1 glycosyltransferase [Sulfuricurvum sp.]MDD2783684.1 glycosyltransferase [Sulfuricurvum sp.]
MKIASVIVTFNRLEKLKLTVQKTLDEEINYLIIINNASTDETKKWLDSLLDYRLRIIHLETNIGGAGGFHVGFKEVTDNTDADWLVCYDDDAYPQKDSIKLFKSIALPKEAGSIAAAVYSPNHQIVNMNRPGINPFWHWDRVISFLFHGRKSIHIQDNMYHTEQYYEIDASSFVGYFVQTDIVKTVGLPRKELFIYADDVLYTLQVRKAGFKHYFFPTLKFIHDCNTIIQDNKTISPLWKVYYIYRNNLELYRMMAGIFFYPLALVKIFSWWRKEKHYNNPVLYKKILFTAIKDAFKKDFSKSHVEILTLCTPLDCEEKLL